MKCEEVQRSLPELMDGEDRELQAHLHDCPECSDLVSDLRLIASSAKELAATEEPPARVWVNIANQLRAEGIIRDPETAAVGPAPVPVERRRRNVWWLVPVAAAIMAAGAYQLSHRNAPASSPQVATQQTPQTVRPQQPTQGPAQTQVAESNPATKSSPAATIVLQATNQSDARVGRKPGDSSGGVEVSPPADDDDEQFLTQASQGAPAMRATYENQLRAVNAEIQETQEYIKQHPGDLDARQHLMEIYQQKAMLYQMAVDRVQ